MQIVSGAPNVYTPAGLLTNTATVSATNEPSIPSASATITITPTVHNVDLSAAAGSLAYTPSEIRTAYGLNSLSLDGSGQTIAIVDAYDNPAIFQTLDAFDNQFGLTEAGQTLAQQYGNASSFLTVLNQSGQNSNLPSLDSTGGWEAEEALDVEWIHAIAPGAQIVLVEANSQSLSDLFGGVATAANLPGVSVVSMSWGLPEGVVVSASDEAYYDSILTTPAGHQGVTFVTSTGDYGTADPEYPAFSPNVVAVGGTSLYVNADNSYNSETGWGYNSATYGTFIGSGGGISQYEAEPAYQLAVQGTGYRTAPDVSFLADPNTGVWMADTYNLPGDNSFEIAGGTSLSSPAWSALFALANQGRVTAGDTTLGSASDPTATNEALYSLPQSDFNAIVGGTNGGYNVTAGYNLVTGLGTPAANLLVPDLVSYTTPIDFQANALPTQAIPGAVQGGSNPPLLRSPTCSASCSNLLTVASPGRGSTPRGASPSSTPAELRRHADHCERLLASNAVVDPLPSDRSSSRMFRILDRPRRRERQRFPEGRQFVPDRPPQWSALPVRPRPRSPACVFPSLLSPRPPRPSSPPRCFRARSMARPRIKAVRPWWTPMPRTWAGGCRGSQMAAWRRSTQSSCPWGKAMAATIINRREGPRMGN